MPGGGWLAAQGRLPLAYMALALGWFGTATGMTVLSPAVIALPHVAPAVVALTHAWVLGFFVTVAIGAVYQLAPVALSTTLWSERLGWWHLALHGTGVPVMVYAFGRWDIPLLAAGGGAVATGVVLFAINVWLTIRRSGKRDAVAWSLVLAAAWLSLTVTAGLLLVANRRWNFISLEPLGLLRAHAHLGLAGFFLTLLQGVTFRLIPMFTLADVPNWRPVRAGLWLSQLGLVALAPALAFHANYAATAAGVAMIAGFGCSGFALQRTLATRKKRRLDAGISAFVRGGWALAIGALTGLWLAWPTTLAGSAPGGLSANVYGVLVLMGGLLPVIAGMMNKIVPFLTWMRAYGPKVGRTATPPATALSRPWLESAALWLHATALPPMLIGTWCVSLPWLVVGSVLFAAGTILFLANMLGVLRHLWNPRSGTTTTSAAKP